MLIGFNCVHPGRPPCAIFGVRPSSVRFHDPTESDQPWRDLYVHKRYVWTNKKRPLGMRGFDKRLERVPQLCGMLHLLLRVLFLQKAIESRYNVSIDLNEWVN